MSARNHSLLQPTAAMEPTHGQRLQEQSRSDSTWTADTPHRPALAHPRRNSVLSSSGRCTPDTSRQDLQVHTYFGQSSSQRRPYANHEATNVVKRAPSIGSFLPPEPATAGQHFQSFLQYCDQVPSAAGHQTAGLPADPSQRTQTHQTPHRSQYQYQRQRNSELESPSCGTVKVEEVIGRQGDAQRVELGEDTGRVLE